MECGCELAECQHDADVVSEYTEFEVFDGGRCRLGTGGVGKETVVDVLGGLNG